MKTYDVDITATVTTPPSPAPSPDAERAAVAAGLAYLVGGFEGEQTAEVGGFIIHTGPLNGDSLTIQMVDRGKLGTITVTCSFKKEKE